MLGFTRAAQTVLSSQKTVLPQGRRCPSTPPSWNRLGEHASVVRKFCWTFWGNGASVLPMSLAASGGEPPHTGRSIERLSHGWLSSSPPPPAPFGLRGVVVVQREGALRQREELT
jgi:hypothetical protein